jgi:glycosyltransferase involved in cell wall biosynthesis
MRICVVYDCLFPHTVGGAERWYRDLAERLATAGHDVTYLTLRQWPRGRGAEIDPRVRVITAGPSMALYTATGRRRILPPLVFGLGVLAHLVRSGRRYDVVHTCAFPYFSLLAAALARPIRGYGLVVDWFEVWSRDYWLDYLGGVGGRVGAAVQHLCARVRQQAFCFSELHAKRLREEGLRGSVSVLRGLYAGSLEPPSSARAPSPVVVFAGRLIREKRAPAGAAGVACAARRIPGLRGIFFGDGPDRAALLETIERDGAAALITAPGFVPTHEVDAAIESALCLLLPSRREGYGMVVVEASAKGTPSIVVASEDNAATELIEDGYNGVVAASADADVIAAAIVRVHEAGIDMRERTATWFAEHARSLSIESSLERVLESYDEGRPRARM